MEREFANKIAKAVIDYLDELQYLKLRPPDTSNVARIIQQRLDGSVDGVEYMDLAEFGRLGFLQEANRLFFHPHGLALEITCDTDGDGYDNAIITGIWDYRDDPEGMVFGEVDPAKVENVKVQRAAHWLTRTRMFEYSPDMEYWHRATDVQPVGWVYPEEPDGDAGNQ